MVSTTSTDRAGAHAKRSRRSIWASTSAVVIFGGYVAGCILADPPADLPTMPQLRPTILHGSVVPSTTAVLGTFPEKFMIPVEFSDPTVPYEWSSFVDYNPFNASGLIDVRSVAGAPPGTSGRVRLLEVAISPPPELDRCHIIEVVVALRLVSRRDPLSAHTPDEPGGDIVSWVYNPGGDLAGCPSLDAGIEASVIDAGEGDVQ